MLLWQWEGQENVQTIFFRVPPTSCPLSHTLFTNWRAGRVIAGVMSSFLCAHIVKTLQELWVWEMEKTANKTHFQLEEFGYVEEDGKCCDSENRLASARYKINLNILLYFRNCLLPVIIPPLKDSGKSRGRLPKLTGPWPYPSPFFFPFPTSSNLTTQEEPKAVRVATLSIRNRTYSRQDNASLCSAHSLADKSDERIRDMKRRIVTGA